jgi:predicted dehydrogenase
MGRACLRLLGEVADVELAGVVDMNPEAARDALRELGLPGVPVATSLTELAGAVGAQAVVNVTVPAAHHPVNVEAQFLTLPVLCEKPAAFGPWTYPLSPRGVVFSSWSYGNRHRLVQSWWYG